MSEWTADQVRNYADACMLVHEGKEIAKMLYAYADLLESLESVEPMPAMSGSPLSVEAITAACDAYTESAVEHGWIRDTIESILRNDDMRAAIAAALAKATGEQS